MGVLWLRAPLSLRRHPPLLLAIAAVALLAALAGSADTFVRAGVESESLKGRLRLMAPLAAGLTLEVGDATPVSQDRARRAAAAAAAHTVPSLGPPVLSSRLGVRIAVPGNVGPPLVLLARTGARAHVTRIASIAGPGVWIADTTARGTGLAPGDTLRVTADGFTGGRSPTVALRVGGIYAALAGDSGNPYWVNWLHEIRTLDPNLPDPAPFVLVSESTFVAAARRLGPVTENRFEFPVDPSHLTVARAKRLQLQLGALRRRLAASPAVGCRFPGQCHGTSSLDAALAIATRDVAAAQPLLTLLSRCGLLIVLGLGVAAGIFLVRRRADEAHALMSRGESPLLFGARTVVESVLPAALGGAAGIAAALLALRGFAPGGTLDGETAAAGIWRAAAAVAAVVIAVGAGAAAAFVERRAATRTLGLPWEVVPLAGAVAGIALVLAGGGLAADAAGGRQPRLAVFLLPALGAAGVAGLAARAARSLLARRTGGGAPAVFLALRRAAGARGLLVVVVVAAAASFATLAYAATLRSSLDRSAAEKAYVANGGDVQALVDPAEQVPASFPFPAAIVELDQDNVSLAGGERVDLLAGDPAALERALSWGRGFGDDPRPLLRRLRSPSPGRLLALATPDAPSAEAIVDQGVRVPVTIVGRAPFPGQSAGRPLLVVSRAALKRFARARGFADPAPLAGGLVWVKGPPAQVEQALRASNLAAQYPTTRDHVLDDPAFAAAERSFGFLEDVGAATAALALVALLLYLQARQRSQAIATAFLRRMGLSRTADAASVALEAAVIALFAAVIGSAVALATAWPIVPHVDALPQYAPGTRVVVPWLTLAGATTAATVAAAALGVLAVTVAARARVGEALRVA